MVRKDGAHDYSHAVTLLAFVLLAALFYAPLLLGLRTFPDGDFTHHFLPFSLFQRAELLAGRLPVWNPYTYAGHPFLADVQAAVFYPLSNLALLLSLPFEGAGARLYFLQVEAVLHVALGGFFTFLLVYALTRQYAAALMSGCTFAFSGYLTGYPPLQLAVLRTAIWLPLLMWLVWRALGIAPRAGHRADHRMNSASDTESTLKRTVQFRRWIVAGTVYATAFLAGHPQTFLHLSYALGAWMLFLWIGSRGVGRWGDGEPRYSSTPPFPTILGLLLFALTAIGLSAAQLLPSLEFTQLSVRANVSYDFVSGGFPLRDTWQLLMPGVLTTFSPLYVGIISLGLAFLALTQLTIDNRQLTIDNSIPSVTVTKPFILFFAFLTLTALLLAYGNNGFLYPLFYRFAPGWHLFRGQERTAYLVALGLSILAGYGMALLPTMHMRWRRFLGLTFATLTIIGVYGFGLFWQLNGHTAVGQWTFLGIAFVTLLLAGLFWGISRRPGWSTQRDMVLIGLTLANLFWANFTTNLAPFGPVRKTILAPEMEAAQGAVAAYSADKQGVPSRIFNEFRVYEDYGMRLGLEDDWGSSPLRLARYAMLHDQFPLDRLWDLTGVQHVLTWRRELFEASQLLGEYPQAADTTYLHRLSGENPRAWVAHGSQIADDAHALALLADHNVDLRTVALLAPGAIVEPDTLQGDNKVALTRLTPTAYEITVESEHGGWLVVTENWMSGWRTQVVRNEDCRVRRINCPATYPSKPYRVNLSFLGIRVPAGITQFRLEYRPDSIANGLLISGSTLIVLILATSANLWITRRKLRAQ